MSSVNNNHNTASGVSLPNVIKLGIRRELKDGRAYSLQDALTVFECLWENLGIRLRWNTLSGYPEISTTQEHKELPKAWDKVTDRYSEICRAHFTRIFGVPSKDGLVAPAIQTETWARWIAYAANHRRVNPFLEHITDHIELMRERTGHEYPGYFLFNPELPSEEQTPPELIISQCFNRVGNIDASVADGFTKDDFYEAMLWFERFIWLAPVALQLWPGEAEVDLLLTLKGAQGACKSMFIKQLPANREWYTESLRFHKDRAKLVESTRGKVYGEYQELLGRDDVTPQEIKAELSTQIHTGRPAYGRFAQDFILNTFKIATTNEANSIPSDLTGYRRHAVLEVEAQFDDEAKQINHIQDTLTEYRADCLAWGYLTLQQAHAEGGIRKVNQLIHIPFAPLVVRQWQLASAERNANTSDLRLQIMDWANEAPPGYYQQEQIIIELAIPALTEKPQLLRKPLSACLGWRYGQPAKEPGSTKRPPRCWIKKQIRQ